MTKQIKFKDFKSYLHGTNEVNYKPFTCACCGEKNEFGKVACLSCHKEIQKAVKERRNLISACESAFDFIDGMPNFNEEAKEVLEELLDALIEAGVKL